MSKNLYLKTISDNLYHQWHEIYGFGCLENKNGEHRTNKSLEKLRQLSQKNLKFPDNIPA